MADNKEIIQSALTQSYTVDGKTVQIDIYRTEDHEGWLLEIVDEGNNSTLWEDEFASEQDALEEALDALKQEGIGCFIGAL